MIAKISCDPGDSCMRTTTLAVLLGCVLYAQAYGQTPRPTAAPESDVVKISTNLIQIDATVTDSKGNPISVFRDGKLLLDGKPVPVNLDPVSGGKVRATGAMSLPPEMQPGDYVLQVIVSDPASKGKAAAQFVQFELL